MTETHRNPALRTGTGRPFPRQVALVTGGSRGLGRALAELLLDRGWHVVVDGRDGRTLASAAQALAPRDHPSDQLSGQLTVIAGDVADPAHRDQLTGAVTALGRLDLLVNNASTLGQTPLPRLADASLDELRLVFAVNTVAPLALIQLLLPLLRRSAGRIVNLSSDAAVEPYPGWGGYGSAKAALDHLSAVLAVEEPAVRVYAIDPGDMATDLHRAAAPEQDLDALPAPRSVAPLVLALATSDLPSGRYPADRLAAGSRA
jgi:NAD(P)-dependent dehydrogenase (short-subunit alcohol dehydrogenase family)